MENSSKGRILGIPNRYYVLAFIILGFIAAQAYPPILPHIQLPAEKYSHDPLFTLPVIGEFFWTNTLTAMVIADILLLLLALGVRKAISSGSLIPKGLPGAVEALLEVIYNLTETTAGKWARAIFPFFATITLLVLVANWTELIPGVDSIGILEHSDHGYAVEEVFPGVKTIIEHPDGEHAEGEQFALIPFVRVLSTDLNFTVALALIAVIMVQVMGVRALGIGYFSKFINVKGLFTRPIFGVIDFGVGLLEMISEISKILSFSFRLFGNIFAGSVLLFVIGTLVPVFAQSLFLMLEFFVGLIQAVVFGMLTMVFMAQATAGHGEHSEEHAH
ncbi:MAG TPA: FoF1 ATP synthase subunit a [Anaerolineales bacterium]|nr:FoF1 ATP synthase subunit a [Anaerolineales bacterium]